ncbi:MAG: low temperature requirement protein A [Streptosporangiaceae bacterium]
MTAQRASMMRDRAGQQRVTNIELFFDLVFVFAVTQLSHFLLSGPGSGEHAHTELLLSGHALTALLAALLLTMVWLLWSYTTWVTNWLDPRRIVVRLLLLVLAAISLFSSAALPTAFERSGLIVGATYLVIQVGRSAFTVVVIGDPVLRRNFQRILAWCLVSGSLALAGGLVHGDARILLWAGAVAVDLIGGAAGFYTPGLGRSRTADWTIEGGHFAERCQGFILIAIGESIVVIGASVAFRLQAGSLTGAEIAAFVIAVVGSIAFWWVYFDRTAEDAAEVIARSEDPGRIGRSAYHLIHPIMVAGIIVAAAADAAVADVAAKHGGTGHASAWAAWLILGGPALFLAGHAAFKAAIWRRISWPRLAAIAALGLFGLLARHVPAVALAACGAAVVVAVAVADHIWRPVPTDAVPTDAVPTDAVPTDAVPIDAVPTDAEPTGAESADAGD